jgi:hypothetical protein
MERKCNVWLGRVEVLPCQLYQTRLLIPILAGNLINALRSLLPVSIHRMRQFSSTCQVVRLLRWVVSNDRRTQSILGRRAEGGERLLGGELGFLGLASDLLNLATVPNLMLIS